MRNVKKISDQKGTLLVEAIAMLGLIAMVTPTLYKKSAERLQEIQDINIAAQARTMNSIVETFVKANYSPLLEATSSSSGVLGGTIELGYWDNGTDCPGGAGKCFETGYSAYVPFGYTPGQLKNYAAPRVYVHRDKDSLISYIVYPSVIDPGRKRAARIASLVGANGGTVMNSGGEGASASSAIYGTGGAWSLENDMLEDIHMSSLVDNSLVVTSTEPITMSDMDSEKFLYRVPPEAEGDSTEYYHNTMVTDLYMGGHMENTNWAAHSQDYYSIFNVRKLTLNTSCNRDRMAVAASSSSGIDYHCDPEVADLYIGKPQGAFTRQNEKSPGTGDGNTGAAWIYGNLSALKENFKLFREDDNGYERASGYDVMQLSRINESSSAEEIVVFRAENKSGSARVSMMDDFVQVFETGSSTGGPTFMVGSAGNGGDGGFIQAAQEGDWHMLRLNSPDQFDEGMDASSFITYINRRGGSVYINGDTSGSTFINDGGGLLEAGKEGSWIRANGTEGTSELHLLSGADMYGNPDVEYDTRLFTVGSNYLSHNYMIRADNQWGPALQANPRIAFRGGRLRVYTHNYAADDDSYGGSAMVQHLEGDFPGDMPGELTGVTTVLTRFTDVLGSTYMGARSMIENGSALVDGRYDRRWTLGVAGSAWVDDLLWARRAWFRDAGFRELHAGYSSFSDYKNESKAAWLNVYDDRVVIRDRARATAHGDTNRKEGSSDVMMRVDSSQVYMTDLEGAWMELADNTARLGTDNNFFYATDGRGIGDTSSAVHMVGSSIANIYTTNDSETGYVDIQKGAMIFRGQPDAPDVSSTIEAKTDMFTIATSNKGNVEDHAQVMVNNEEMRLRYIDFTVDEMNEAGSSTTRFKVVPDGDNVGSDDANVQVRGSFHVTGNDIIHVASNINTKAVGDSTAVEPHALFEIDPEYIQVWAKTDRNGQYVGAGGSSTTDYQAMFRINPYDITGAVSTDTSSSVYIRKGAIELEESTARDSDVGYAADEGYGYIMANRLVSNVSGDNGTVPSFSANGYETRGNEYDRYMVNPAYTSVMHDIKLTTRGGARLSDILPDYVLKGVYNLINNCDEGQTSGFCPESNTGMDKWASPYIGKLPYASCPPGYRNLATVIPLSFNVGRAGDLVKETKEGHARWVVNTRPRQAKIIEKALSLNGNIAYPALQEVSSITFNTVYDGSSSFAGDFSTLGLTRSEGWFFGFDAVHPDNSGSTNLSAINPAPISGNVNGSEGYVPWEYTPNTNSNVSYAVAEPLYFQQNTWLKTTVDPTNDAWNAYMGFIYDTTDWPSGSSGLGGVNAPVKSNYNIQGYNDSSASGTDYGANYVWNLFPIPTNTLEGHATVYCYFDRSQFGGDWGNLVDPVDQLARLKSGEARGVGQKSTGDNSSYVHRLNDPSLKYNDPW